MLEKRIIEIGDAQIAAAAPREIPTFTMTGNNVAINNTPKPVADDTAKTLNMQGNKQIPLKYKVNGCFQWF